eukprot:365310-Chlamydomonas_euryale.AAC.5
MRACSTVPTPVPHPARARRHVCSVPTPVPHPARAGRHVCSVPTPVSHRARAGRHRHPPDGLPADVDAAVRSGCVIGSVGAQTAVARAVAEVAHISSWHAGLAILSCGYQY